MQLRILTWHIHGSYLYYLTQTPHQFYLPTKPGKPERYGGKIGSFHWGENVHEISAVEVRYHSFDCILFQTRQNYLQDQHEILSETQRQLPRLYLEHDPPREHPTDTQHVVDDPDILLIHVTHFNRLMWDNGQTPTHVIEHGVIIPDDVIYTGELTRGIVVTNGLRKRGRRLGADIFQQVRQSVPLDLVGMDAKSLDGLGEIPHAQLPAFTARYRFFFHPVRYTSLGLAVCEAMMVGLPIIGLATTEIVSIIENGVSGYINNNVEILVERMQELLASPQIAYGLGQAAREVARSRFSIQRFTQDWNTLLEYWVTHRSLPISSMASSFIHN
jgi:glycosyltransferase involved in cell wall biosynthesis